MLLGKTKAKMDEIEKEKIEQEFPNNPGLQAHTYRLISHLTGSQRETL